MQDLRGKTAVITGGASGIGLAMAEAFGREGMNVMLADIEQSALEAAVQGLRDKQIRCEGVICDVTSREAVRRAALETIAKFGKVHVVCNNAGIGAGGILGQVPERDWDWVIDVNLKGVVYGVETFTPLIESHGEGGHFVNTASMAGMVSPPGMEAYCATKFAVVAMSEGWSQQLAPRGIGVSILCPGFVNTRINESRRNRTAAYGPDTRQPPPADAPPSPVTTGIPTGPVGAMVVQAVKDKDLYIFTHPDLKAPTRARFDRILAAFDKCAASPALEGVKTAPAGPLAL